MVWRSRLAVPGLAERPQAGRGAGACAASGENTPGRAAEMRLRLSGDDGERKGLVAAHALTNLGPQPVRYAEFVAQPIGGIEHMVPGHRAGLDRPKTAGPAKRLPMFECYRFSRTVPYASFRRNRSSLSSFQVGYPPILSREGGPPNCERFRKSALLRSNIAYIRRQLP